MYLPKADYKILVVGCGGTGSQLLPSLMQICSNVTNVSEIILADGDCYECKNLSNQRCTQQDIDKNKALACAQRYKAVYPNLNITFVDDYIKSPEQIKDILSSDSYYGLYNVILIGAVDNNASRKVLYEYFKHKRKTIYIDSGNDSGESYNNRDGQIVIGVNINEQCNLPSVGELFEEVRNNDEDIQTVGTCMRFSNEHPQNIATNMMAANIISSSLINILMFGKIENNITFFDADKIKTNSRI